MPEVIESDLFCPECGYNLRQIESTRCPECGMEIDRTKLGESIIPWLHRAKIGRYRAFWRTVWLATWPTARLRHETALPARFGDAVLFRRLVVVHALIPLGILFGLGYLAGLANAISGLWESSDPVGSVLQWLGLPMGWLCLALFLFAGTGACSYFFHPRALSDVQQNRAVALSYYACAPLAYLPIALALMIGATIVGPLLARDRISLPIIALVLLAGYTPIGAAILATISTPVRMLGFATHCSGLRQTALAIFLPVAWAVLGFLLLLMLPLAATTLALMFLSLRS